MGLGLRFIVVTTLLLSLAGFCCHTVEEINADTVFKCTDANGHILFSDQPCKADSVEILSMPDEPVPTLGNDPSMSVDSSLQPIEDEQSNLIDSRDYVPSQSCEMDMSAWKLHMKEYRQRKKNCGSKHSSKSIQQLEQNLKAERNRDMKKHSETSRESRSKKMGELGCHLSLRKSHKKHGKNYFRGERCTEDCGGHVAGYNWAGEKDIHDCFSCYRTPPSPSFTEGCMAFVMGK